LRRTLLHRLLLAGLLVGLLGISLEHFQHRSALREREERYAQSLALPIASAAATVSDDVELRHLVQWIAAEAEASSVALVGGSPPQIMAGSGAGWSGRSASELFNVSRLVEILEAERQAHFHDALLDHHVYVFPLKRLRPRLMTHQPVSVVVQLDARARRHELWGSTAKFSGFAIVILGVIGFLMHWIVQRHAINPLVEMAQVVERQTAGDANAPVPVEFSSQEFTRFGALLNDMVSTRDAAHRDLQRSEAELRLLGQITRIADRAEDFDEALRSCCAQVSRFLLWPMGHVWFRDEEDRGLLRPSNIWHVSCPEIATDFVHDTSMLNFREGEDLAGRVLECKEPIWVEDCWAERWFTRSTPETSAIRSAVGFPIFMGQEVVAVLELFDVKTREREVRPVALMHNIGLTLGQVLQRRHNHELLVRRNKELVEAMQMAVSATHAKSEFLANMSHEIRTPLTAIIGYAELMEGAKSDSERAEYTTTIQRNGEHLLQLINDILDVSKIEAGRLEVERISCSPAEVIQSVIDAMAPRARTKGLEFSVSCAGPLPEQITTDPTRLNQILLNLVSNAIKFTLAGRVELTVGLVALPGQDSPRLSFAISDTGIGIPETQLRKIFRPFSQADMSTTRRFGGTGLGLSISQNLVRLLGGELSAESQQGTGSVFRFDIETGPLDGVAMLDSPVWSSPSGDTQPADRRDLTLDGARILLAEDGPDNQRLITRILSSAGAEVEVADNGAIACERALEAQSSGRPFDLILMDMQMPVMDGYAATMNLRQQGYRRSIVALTANVMKGDREKCMAVGCDSFVGKPVKKELLIGTLIENLDRDL
jgi:signal transduction histidine kinase